jgi:peroxiredoxin
LLLALVFFVAGASKLADRQGSKQSMSDFGVPVALASPLGILLPLSELGVATALVPASTAWWGALGALTLLVLFVAGIGVNLARGRKPECRCFGQLHSAPASGNALLRNGVLAVVAGFVVWRGYDGAGTSALSWLGDLTAAQLVLLVLGLAVLGVVAIQWWFQLHLLGQIGRLLVRMEELEAGLAWEGGAPPQAGLPVGSMAPEFGLSGLHGETLTLEDLRSSGKSVLLFFTDPNCGPCTAMLPEVGRWQQEHAKKLTLALISRGEVEENRTKAQEHALRNVLLQKDREVSESYEVRGTPSAVFITPDGKVASPVAGGAQGIRALLSHAVGERAQLPMQPQQPQAQGQPCPNCGKVHPNGNGAVQQAERIGPKIGKPAPEVRLADLKGNEVSLQEFRGKESLVLFWNPGCGFCQQMLPDLKEWEASLPECAPKLLVVSAGTVEANKEMGLTSTVVLDQQFAVGRVLGASGTPSAVLVDAEGMIASEVAVGAVAVLELARGNRTTA